MYYKHKITKNTFIEFFYKMLSTFKAMGYFGESYDFYINEMGELDANISLHSRRIFTS